MIGLRDSLRTRSAKLSIFLGGEGLAQDDGRSATAPAGVIEELDRSIELPDGSIAVDDPPRGNPPPSPSPPAEAPNLAEEEARLARGEVKIGSAWIYPAPASLRFGTSNELMPHRVIRSPGSLVERTGHAQELVILRGKVDWESFNGGLQKVLAQFACCPFLPVRNPEIERMLRERQLLVASEDGINQADLAELMEARREVQDILNEVTDAIPGGPHQGRGIQDIQNLVSGVAEVILRRAEQAGQEPGVFLETQTSNDLIQILQDAGLTEAIVEAYGSDVSSPDGGGFERAFPQVEAWIRRMAGAQARQRRAARRMSFPVRLTLMDRAWLVLDSYEIGPDPSKYRTLSYELVFRVFNYLPYARRLAFRSAEGLDVEHPEESAHFQSAWQRLIASGKFAPLPDEAPNTRIVLRPFGAELAPDTDEDEPAAQEPPREDRWSEALELSPDLSEIQVLHFGDYAEMPIEGCRLPTMQWLGSGRLEASVLFLTDSLGLVENLRALDQDMGRISSALAPLGKIYQFEITDPLLNALGMTVVDIGNIDIETAGPSAWAVSLKLHEITPKLQEIHRTHRIGGTNANRVREALEHAISARGGDPVSQEVWDELTEAHSPDEGPAIILPSRRFRQLLEEAGAWTELENLPVDEQLGRGLSELMKIYAEGLAIQQRRLDRNQSTGAWARGASNDEIKAMLDRIDGVLGPAVRALDRAVARYGDEVPEPYRIYSTDRYAEASRSGQYTAPNLYPDFPEFTVAQSHGPRQYFNPDANAMMEESPAWKADPWHFLMPVSPSGSGLPAYVPEGDLEALRQLASVVPDYSDITNPAEVYSSADRDDRTGGPNETIEWSNQLDKPMMAAAQRETLEEISIDGSIDFMNMGSVRAQHKDFMREAGQRARQMSEAAYQGVAGAFPTFWIAFVEKDNNELLLFDDLYAYRAVKEISIHRQKSSPMDVAYVVVSDLYGSLTPRDTTGGREFGGLSENTSEENPSLERGRFPVQPGTEVIIKLGYGNNPEKLATAFTGQVAEVEENREGGRELHLMLQSYGAELLEPLNTNAGDKYADKGSARELAELMLAQPTVQHFGRTQLSWAAKVLIGLNRAQQDEFLARRKSGALILMDAEDQSPWVGADGEPLGRLDGNRRDFQIHDVNIWLPHLDRGRVGAASEVISQFPCRKYSPFITLGMTPWQIIQEIMWNHPGMAVGVRPYDARATLFMGLPDMPYIQSSRALVSLNQAASGAAANPDQLTPFRKYHACHSGRNLIRNEMGVTKQFYNRIVLGWDRELSGQTGTNLLRAPLRFGKAIFDAAKRAVTGGPADTDDPSSTLPDYQVIVNNHDPALFATNAATGAAVFESDTASARHAAGEIKVRSTMIFDSSIPKEDIRTLYVEKRNVTDEPMAIRYQASIMADAVRRAYKGSLWMRSDMDIWPNDVICLYDHHNRMYGSIEVDEVVVHLDRDVGFCYEIRPNALVSIQDPSAPAVGTSNWVARAADGSLALAPGFSLAGPFTPPLGALLTDPAALLRRLVDLVSLQGASDYSALVLPKLHHWIGGWMPLGAGEESLKSHPIDIFPLMYQGKPFWPYKSRGNAADAAGAGGLDEALQNRSLIEDLRTLLGGAQSNAGILRGLIEQGDPR